MDNFAVRKATMPVLILTFMWPCIVLYFL